MVVELFKKYYWVYMSNFYLLGGLNVYFISLGRGGILHVGRCRVLAIMCSSNI